MARAGPAPSSVSGDPKRFRSEQHNRPIYIGRPAEKRGPPISIYHEAFAQLKDTLRDVMKVLDREEERRVDDTAKLFLKATDIYETEQARVDAMKPLLKSVLDLKDIDKIKGSRLEMVKGSGFEADGIVKERILDGGDDEIHGVTGCFEYKNELGGGDATVQGALTLRKCLVLPKVRTLQL